MLIKRTLPAILTAIFAVTATSAYAQSNDLNAAGLKLRGNGTVDDAQPAANTAIRGARGDESSIRRESNAAPLLARVEKVERSVTPEKVEKLEKPEKIQKVEKVEKPEKVEKVEKIEKVEKPEKAEKAEKIEKVEKPEKLEKVEKVEKPEKLEKLEKSGERR